MSKVCTIVLFWPFLFLKFYWFLVCYYFQLCGPIFFLGNKGNSTVSDPLFSLVNSIRT